MKRRGFFTALAALAAAVVLPIRKPKTDAYLAGVMTNERSGEGWVYMGREPTPGKWGPRDYDVLVMTDQRIEKVRIQGIAPDGLVSIFDLRPGETLHGIEFV